MTTDTPMPAAGGPVTETDRIAYLDILRGFAIMAIFVVNIKGMFMPFAWYMNPTAWGTDLEQHIATVQKFIIDDKWRTNFTALYGAGLAMIWARLEARGEGKGVLWRRNIWLLVFGVIHLFLIWIGDILTTYAIAGFLAVLFVRKSIRAQWTWGIILMIIGAVWMSGFMMISLLSEEMAAEFAPMMWDYTAPINEEAIAAYGGGVLDQLKARVPEATMFLSFGILLSGMLPMTVGLMVTGMALFRSGFYAGRLGKGRYLVFAVIGLGAAWALDAYQVGEISSAGYTFESFVKMQPFGILDGWLGAFGYAALVGLLFRMGITFSPVAAIGRMAFTNYITCSLIGTTLAGGHAFGLFGEITLVQLTWIVAATFVGMLIWSPLWLKFFRFGPLEWLWRSLVYGKVQKFTR